MAVPLAYALLLELLLVAALPFGIAKDQWGDAPLPLLVGDSPVIVIALVAVPAFALVLYALRFPNPWPGSAAGTVLIAVPAVTWTALDFLHTKANPGGFWGPLFASQHDQPAASLAALGGPWLVTAALVAVNYSLALAVARRRTGLPAALGTLAIVGALLVAAPEPSADGPPLRVAAIQPGYDTSEYHRTERSETVLRRFRPGSYELAALDLIRDLEPLTLGAARAGARLLVWPEAALWVDPRTTAPVHRALVRLARRAHAAIVVPYFLPGPDHGATVVVEPDGAFSPAQPKQRPMWFWGEGGGNRVPPEPAPTGVGRVGTTLGVDNQDPAPVRELAGARADVVTSSTHDWRELAVSQRALSRLRAIESGAPLVRADWRFGSALFDARGDVAADAGEGRRRTALVATVATRSETTPYVGIGDVLGWAALVAGAALVGAGGAVRRFRASRARSASPRSHRPVPSSPS